jgi:hypothetical protein
MKQFLTNRTAEMNLQQCSLEVTIHSLCSVSSGDIYRAISTWEVNRDRSHVHDAIHTTIGTVTLGNAYEFFERRCI